MALQLTLSCDWNNSQNGPTLIHSAGVEHYKIPPEVIRILQENVSNDSLSDHERGVLCQAAPQRILDILQQKGFAVQNQTEERRAIWTLVQGGGGGHQPPAPHPTPSGDGGGHQPPVPQPTPGGGNDADQGGEEEEEQQEEEGTEE